ncbi:MAG: DnaD domain protein [Anaerovoracaceae bacterium]|jgi:DnaD/phage-associated family protein
MSFKRENIKEYYLHDTRVENVFINEYMIDAPGDYVKVYLFALMYGEINVGMNNESIAKQLKLPIEDVLKAWTYWEGKGVIRKIHKDDSLLHYGVELLNLKERIYGIGVGSGKRKPKDLLAGTHKLLEDEKVKDMFRSIEQTVGRAFGGNEPITIISWIRDYGITPEVVVLGYDYCMRERKNCRTGSVGSIIKGWAERGLLTEKQVSEYLEENDRLHYMYKRVFQALGFLRAPSEEEKRIMGTWFNDMGFTIDKVLEACKKTSGISNPNINYVNSILTNWSKGQTKPGGKAATDDDSPIQRVLKSYEKDRKDNENKAEERRQEVFRKVPRIKEIEEEIRRLGMNISKEMLKGGTISKKNIREMKEKSEALNSEKAYLLTDNNYQTNYMDIWYSCDRCKDTGLLDTGERCSCFETKLREV